MDDMTEPFVLDRTENPHPRMLEHALQLRRSARASNDPIVGSMWLGYLDCMCDATGETSAAISAWLNKHDDPDLAQKIATVASETLPMPRRR